MNLTQHLEALLADAQAIVGEVDATETTLTVEEVIAEAEAILVEVKVVAVTRPVVEVDYDAMADAAHAEWVADNATYNKWKAANIEGFRQDEHEDYVHMMEMRERYGAEMMAEALADVTTEWSI